MIRNIELEDQEVQILITALRSEQSFSEDEAHRYERNDEHEFQYYQSRVKIIKEILKKLKEAEKR